MSEQKVFKYHDTVICRILGNELPPRDMPNSKIRSLRYILRNEPSDICHRFWVLNNIVDTAYKNELKSLLDDHAQIYTDLPFDITTYKKLKTWEDKIRYAININYARNYGIKHCQTNYKFVICLDQDCFFTNSLLNTVILNITNDQRLNPDRQYYGLIMKRIINERQDDFDDLADEEPHLVFRNDAQQLFDEKIIFGLNDKIELLKNVGYKPDTNFLVDGPICVNVGTVLHHSYGEECTERDLLIRKQLRGQSILNFINQIEKRYA